MSENIFEKYDTQKEEQINYRYPVKKVKLFTVQLQMLLFLIVGITFMIISPMWLSGSGTVTHPASLTDDQARFIGFAAFLFLGFVCTLVGLSPIINRIRSIGKWQDFDGTVVGYSESGILINGDPVLNMYAESRMPEGYRTLCVTTLKTKEPFAIGTHITFQMFKDYVKIDFKQ